MGVFDCYISWEEDLRDILRGWFQERMERRKEKTKKEIENGRERLGFSGGLMGMSENRKKTIGVTL